MSMERFSIGGILKLRDRLAELELIGSESKDAARILKTAAEAIVSGALTADEYDSFTKMPEGKSMTGTLTKATPEKVFGNGSNNNGGTTRTRVKPAGDQYTDKRASAVHVKTRRPVFDETGEEVTRPSQRSLALNGALLKYAAKRAGIEVNWSEHDQALFNQGVNEFEWAAFSGEADVCKIYAPGAVKAPLLDDSTSGGLEAAPIFFDQDFITTPLLTGELLPEIDLKPISRGRLVESGQISSPTAVWGEGDAAVGSIFDSTNQVSALNSTVYDLSCHCLIGRNFLADAAVSVGTILVQLIGERMSNEIERAISVGSGSMPSGIMGASGTTAVNFSSSAVTIAKMLELLFAVPKELRGPGFAFAGNEVSYRRLRSVQTGISGDVRLALGSEVEEYSAFGRPFKIVHHLANTQQFGGDLKAYRLYRRLGSQIEWTTQGENLQRRNEALLTVRQRWAGRVMRGASFAVVSDAQA